MTVSIQVLGPATLRHGADVVKIKGNKAWALLAYLLLTPTSVNRQQLVSALFVDADDPFRALRWNLTELRRALRDPNLLRGDDLDLDRLNAHVDVEVLGSGRWWDAIEIPGVGRELLEGMSFSGAPAFEAWLLNQRRRLHALSKTVLREAALSMLGTGEAESAVDVAVRLVALDPLNEAAQALLIRSYVAVGDSASASRQLAACVQLLRDELGVEPGAQVYEAIRSDPLTRSWRPFGEPAARAQLEAGQAAIRGGALEAGLDCLRRAAAEAHSCGAAALKASALFEIGSALAHRTSNRRHDEAATVLHSVIEEAERLDDGVLEGRACYELAWIEYLEAHYERSGVWSERAFATSADPSVQAAAGYVRGKALMEMGRYGSALEVLRGALTSAEESGDPLRVTGVLAALGRALLLMGALDEASIHLIRAVELIRAHGLIWYAPCAEAYLGEVYRIQGDKEQAAGLLDHALAIARENKDMTSEALAAHGRALLQADSGDVQGALNLLREVTKALLEDPEYVWAEAWTLDALCSILVDHDLPEAAGCVARLEEVAGRAGMNELLTHAYLYRHDLGDPEGLEAARVLARDIDNPALHQRVSDRKTSAKV